MAIESENLEKPSTTIFCGGINKPQNQTGLKA